MCYCNNDFVSKFDEIKDLPEEVATAVKNIFILIILFDFLVKQHAYDYQTEARNTLDLISGVARTNLML